MSPTVLSDHKGPVFRLTLNRPEKRNALNQEMIERLLDALDEARADPSVRVVVLKGAGTVFSAGADLDALKALAAATPEENQRDSALLARLFREMTTHPKIIVAQVNGHAIAGGCGLVAAADFAIAADGAKLGFTEVRIGFVPAIVSAVVLKRIRGIDARRLFLAGTLISASEAARLGLLTTVVPAGVLDDEVDRMARRLARTTSPQAVALTKELLSEMGDRPFESALEYGARMNVRARASEDCRAGIDAFLRGVDPPWVTGDADKSHED